MRNKKILSILILISLTFFVSGCSDKKGFPKSKNLKAWSNEISLADVVNASQENFRSWLKKQPNKKDYLDGLQIYADSSIDKKLLDNLTAPLNSEILTLGDRGPKVYTVFISSSRKWIIDKIQSLNKTYTDGKNPCGIEDFTNAIQACAAGSDVIYLMIHDANAIASNPLPLAVAVHEYFHLVQENYVNTKVTSNKLSDIPAWLVEGSADWIGLAYYYEHYKLDYLPDRTRFGQYDIPTAVSNPLSDYIINDPSILFPYSIGRSAVELIVAFSGMEGLLNIFQNFGESGNFPSSFEKATGITLADFYSYFEKVRPKIELQVATKHLVCGENLPIETASENCAKNTVKQKKKNSGGPSSNSGNMSPSTNLGDASEGLACNGYEGKTITSTQGVKLICKVESNGNIHWVIA
jgi:hypothetical protein